MFHPLGASTSPCSTWPSLSPAYHVQLPKSRQTKEVLPLSRPAIVALPRQMQSPGDRKVFVRFCCHFLVWNVMIDDVSPLFPEGLNVWWHFVILLCFLLLKDSFIEPDHFKLNLTSFTLAAIVREGFNHSTRCIHLVAPFLPVQRWMPQPYAARRSIATLLQLSQEFQQRPPSSQHPLPSPAFQIDSKVAGAQFFTWPRAFKP